MPLKISNEPFIKRVEKGINNQFMRETVARAQDSIEQRRQKAIDELGNWEEWRSLAEEIRQHVLNKLDYYLMQLSENVAKRGGHVFFAATAREATDYICQVIETKQAKKIVKSKSMVTEEINLNEQLEKQGCQVIETDLGEYILQMDDRDLPSHIIAPALHKNKEQIRKTFAEKLGFKGADNAAELARHARKMLRKEFLTADVGITGCNFAVAETGSITLVTNEGNAELVTALPKTQITVMGMERIVPTFEELDVLVSMLSRSAVGQKLPSYVTVLTGPRNALETDGPEEFHLVIVDNGRSNLLGTEFQPILQCIRCSACVNICPVYRHIGGHAYGSIYSGPIGAVLSPFLGGYDDFKDLPYASTLCGACSEVCPVKIPLHELLLKHRQRIVEQEGKAPFSEKLFMKAFGLGTSNRFLYNMSSKVAALRKGADLSKGVGPLKAWLESRDLPAPAKERFRDWYKNYKKKEERNAREHTK